MSKIDIDKMTKLLEKALQNLTKEDIEKYFPERKLPKGWVSIEEHLPYASALDFVEKGYTEIKVKYANGKVGKSGVCDHNIWYYDAKDAGITHWWND